MSSTEPVFYVNDSVHGSIELSGKSLCYIIDTPQFQRLRKIKQLGGACYVYPGATHTRFDHSIGVCFIASELMSHLKKDILVEGIIKKYKGKCCVDYEKCVKVAALCHDLGHGPYSHLYDFAVKKVYETSTDELMEHEYRSKEIVNQILDPSKDLFSKHETNENEKKIIGDMITFSKKCKKLREKFLETKENWTESTPAVETKEKHEADYYDNILKILSTDPEPDALFFYEIVANGFTEIDVDKMDYFIRDGHGLGLSSFFDWRRYIQTLKVCTVKLDQKVFYRLCSRDKRKKIKKKSKKVLKEELPETIYKKIEEKEMIIVEQAEFHYGMKQRNPIEEHYFYKKVFPGEGMPEAHHLLKDEVSEMLPEHFHENALMVYWNFHELSKIPDQAAEDIKEYQKNIPTLISEQLEKISDDDKDDGEDEDDMDGEDEDDMN